LHFEEVLEGLLVAGQLGRGGADGAVEAEGETLFVGHKLVEAGFGKIRAVGVDPRCLHEHPIEYLAV